MPKTFAPLHEITRRHLKAAGVTGLGEPQYGRGKNHININPKATIAYMEGEK